MARLDLNARRAARSEAENEPHQVTLGFDPDGKALVFRLKPRMPVEYMDLLGAGQLGAALRILLVDPDQWDAFRMGEPDSDDLAEITELYSVSLGESDGSASSSTNGGSSSKLTSLSATDLISRTPAMDEALSGSDGSSSSSGGSPRTPARVARSTARRGGTTKSS
jgi:hypothetical protein